MEKKELIKEVAQLKEKYHCRKLDVEFQNCFTLSDGAARIDSVEAIVYVDDDMLTIHSEGPEAYDCFFSALRKIVSKRQRNVYNNYMYESIAEYMNDWFGFRTCYEDTVNGVHILVEQNRMGWWESYATNEDFEEVADNFDCVQFERILEMVKAEKEDADRARFETEQHLRRTA